jgi:flagellar L-ring protein FlgH
VQPNDPRTFPRNFIRTFTRTPPMAQAILILAMALVADPGSLHAKNKSSNAETLAKYLARIEMAEAPAPARTTGSVWVDTGRMAALTRDYKAMAAGDLVTIVVSQGLTASNSGNVSSARTLTASSGIDSLPRVKSPGMASLFGLHSSEALAGKAAATSSSQLNTSLAGRVVAVLPSGNLVVEAERSILMNNEKQTIVLRGVVRPGDVGPNNSVASNAISNLELEIKGKGVISDGVRRPHPLLRMILRILDF